MQDNQMLTLRVLGKRVLHLINQQHVINRFTTVTRLGADLLAVGDIIRHGIAIEPHLALHGVQIGTESELFENGKTFCSFKVRCGLLSAPPSRTNIQRKESFVAVSQE